VTSGHHNGTMITDRPKFTTKLAIYRMSSFHFSVSINSVFPLSCMLRRRKVPTQIFGNVQCLILHIKTNSTLQCWCRLASYIFRKSRQNWKLKISNMAHIASSPGDKVGPECDRKTTVAVIVTIIFWATLSPSNDVTLPLSAGCFLPCKCVTFVYFATTARSCVVL